MSGLVNLIRNFSLPGINFRNSTVLLLSVSSLHSFVAPIFRVKNIIQFQKFSQ